MTSGEPGQDGGGEERSPSKETARYIADVAGGISVLARKAGLEVLAYLLEMARIEAEETVHKPEPQ